jgi:hypothetical protein
MENISTFLEIPTGTSFDIFCRTYPVIIIAIRQIFISLIKMDRRNKRVKHESSEKVGVVLVMGCDQVCCSDYQEYR